MNDSKIPKVSILIRSFNELPNLKILLPILNNQSYKNFQVVYLDSGSTDGSLEYVKKYEAKFEMIIDKIKKEDFTYGGALNKCAELAIGSDYLISLSAHCFPTQNKFIENYVKIFQQNNSDIVFGRQVGYSKSSLSESSHLNNWFREDYADKTFPFINNGNAGYPYYFWKKYKFDSSLTGCEDIEIANRGLVNNCKITYGKDIAVEHYHEEKSRQIYNRFYREAIAISQIFPGKFKMPIYKCAMKFTLDVKDSLKFRKLTQLYKKNNVISILNYFFMKNIAQYFGLKGSKNNNISEPTLDREKMFFNKYFFNQ